MSGKRIAAIKRVSLAGISEGWDDECYAWVVPTTYEDNKRIAEMDFSALTQAEQIDYQLSFVRDHFVSGKIRVYADGEFTLTDMTPEDTAASVTITDYLYAEIMGFGLDPKGIREAAIQSALPTNEPPATATPSSAD